MPDRSGTSGVGRTHVTRVDVLIFHLQRATAETRYSLDDFATAFAAAYHRQVPEHARSLDLTPPVEQGSYADYAKAVGRLRKRVQRYIDGGLHLPTELEEAWVEALPDDYASACRATLARRYGFLAAVAPDVAACTDGEAVGRVMTQTGHVLSGLSAALADGCIDAADLQRDPHLMDRIRDAQAALESVAARVAAVRSESVVVDRAERFQ